MAEQHGVPGEWARVRGTMRSLWPLFLACTFFGAFASAAIIGRGRLVCGVLFGGSVIAVGILWRHGVRRVEQYFRGAHGEETVARMLAGLPIGYHVFHDFKAGNFHVDHVVVGASGVFSVETKNWRAPVTVAEGYVLCDGVLPSRDPVKQAVREADAVKRALAKRTAGRDIGVTPILCFASGSYRSAPQRVGGATLVNLPDLARHICAQPAVFSAEDLDRIVPVMMAASR